MSTVISDRVFSSYIGGRFRAADIDRGVDDLNPSDRDDVIGRVPEGSAADVAAAVDAAHAALSGWRKLAGPARAEHLYRWAGAIDADLENLAQALSREVGKPISESRGEIARCIMILRYYAGEAVRAMGEVIPAQVEGALQFSLREPLGVVALITPWNFPAAIPLWKAAPAIAFGNTVVLKPAEQAVHTALLLAQTAQAAGLPAGVFNVVLGQGARIGDALLRAEAVRAVSFTGSSAVGARVAQTCAERNIRYQTEMGGKNVVIVLPDADLGLAAKLTAGGAMRYAGQKCTATSRAVVVKDIEEAFLERLRAEVVALRLGPVTDAACAVGPLIDRSTRDKLHQAVTTSEARRVVGGAVPDAAGFARGNFLEPTVLRDVHPDSMLAQDELFGPVLATLSARDVDEAIALANHSRYGLSASIFTRDLRAALSYIQRIEVGMVRVNGDTTGVDPHAPFGGMKGSSSGSREQGPAAREFYTETKTVQINP
ncbi:MAG TPA: aldehyde dehydrogenase family protein [Longimicrobiales bacterium]